MNWTCQPDTLEIVPDPAGGTRKWAEDQRREFARVLAAQCRVELEEHEQAARALRTRILRLEAM